MAMTTVDRNDVDAELAGLDALELAVDDGPSGAARIWRASRPKLGATRPALAVWQLVVWSGWKPDYVLPGPTQVIPLLWHNFDSYVEASVTTLQRALVGF